MNKVFGLLTFIEFTKNGKDPKALYKCECGIMKELFVYNVKRGLTKSCGCSRKKIISQRSKSHGLSKHPLYGIRRSMIDRCYNKKSRSYPRYGGNGIIVCREWLNSFIEFYDWAILNGWEKGMNIDKDIKGGRIYSPDNCVIVRPIENAKYTNRSRVLNFGGRNKILNDWSIELGIDRRTIARRIDVLKWSIEKALSTPTLKKKNDTCKK